MRALFDALLEDLGRAIAPNGFRLSKANQTYRRDFPLGRQSFHLAWIPHKADFDITADLAIRFNDVENAVNSFEDRLLPSMRSKTSSLGIEIGNLTVKKQKRWTVISEADVAIISSKILADFKATALPWFETFSDMEVALDSIARCDETALSYNPFHFARALRAVKMAAIIAPNRLKVISDLQRRCLARYEPNRLHDFEGFCRTIG